VQFKGWPSQTLGAVLIAASLLDVFLTVLYARTGIGVMSPWVTEGVWHAFRWAGRRLLRWRDFVLSLAGPSLLIVLAAVWVGLLAVGFALIYWPMLGSKVHATGGEPTPLGFGTAFYYSLTTMTTVGSGSSVIEAGAPQFLVAIQSALGIAIFTLTITYFVQIYNAVLERNALALKLHVASDSTADAARLVAGLGAAGDFEGARGTLGEWAGEMTKVFESHHLYSVLHVFRFVEPEYAAARIILLTMDSVTLIRSAVHEERYAALRGSAGVTALWGIGLQTMRELSGIYLPGGGPEDGDVDPQTERQWRRRYAEACRVLAEAGIELNDGDAGAAAYVELRKEWDRYMVAFAHYMAHTAEEMDVAGTRA
jgi:hypothetical protein